MTTAAPAPAPDRFSLLRARLVPALEEACLWGIIFISLLKLPEPPSSGLDPSWRMVIGHALGQGMQWGTELVFTYGPLGYLLAATNHGANYTDFLIWQVVSNVVFATAIWLLGRELGGLRKLLYYLYFLFLVANYLDAMHMTMILLLALTWLREPVRNRPWLTALVGVALGILSLIKFTNLMLAGFSLACVAGLCAWRRDWRGLALTTGSYALTFAAGWILCGQSPRNIPAYLLTSIQSSSGYGDGMSLYEAPLTLFIGLGAAFSLAGYYLLSLGRRADTPRAVTVALILGAGSFINWKHGYTRADGHVFAHYLACMLVPLAFPAISFDDGPWRRTKAALLAVSFFFSVWGILAMLPVAITDAPAIWNQNLKKVVNAVKAGTELKGQARQLYQDTAKPHALPAVRRVVGEETIDMLGNEQAYLLFNRFNYRPRPVFQTYLPYTAELLRLNEDFFKSPRAPRYVLQKMDTIDYRLPALEDSLATRQIYYRYKFVLEEKGMLLWERREPETKLEDPKLLEERRVGFGEVVPVPNQGDTPIWAEVVIRPTLLGSIRAFLYKAPILQMAVSEGGDFKNSYRIVRRMAEAGFLIYPHFSNAYNVQRFMAGDAPPRAEKFSIELPPEQRKYFQPDITVRFYSLPPMPRSPGIVSGTTEDRFRMFDRVPVSANALYPVTILAENDREVLFAHPPSSVEFLVNFPARRVTGGYGIAETAYRPPNATDGAEFIIEWVGADGRTVILLSRVLQPLSVAADRGMQSFSVDLPRGGGRLLLRINSGPNNNAAFDWTYWTDIKFKE